MTKQNDKATARPWRVVVGSDGTTIESPYGEVGRAKLVAQVFSDSADQAEEDANAALIVKAVNEFDALVAISAAAWELRKIGKSSNRLDDALDALYAVRSPLK